MPFSRIDHHFGRNAEMLQGTIQSLRLTDGIVLIVLASKYQRRSLRVTDIGRRRVAREHVRMLPGRAEIPLVALRTVLGFELGLLVEHARAKHGRLEASGLAHRPSGHFAAIGPTANSEAIWIGVAACDHS